MPGWHSHALESGTTIEFHADSNRRPGLDSLRCRRDRDASFRADRRRRAPRSGPRAPQAVAAHRRPQRLSVGASREGAARHLDKLDIRKPQPSIMTDIPRLKAGGVGGQFWSVYVPVELAGQRAVTATLEQIDIVHQMMRKYPGDVRAGADGGRRRADLQEGKDRVAHRHGGRPLDRQLARRAAHVHRLGARYMTLTTHSKNTAWADSATDVPAVGGLRRSAKRSCAR